MIKKLLFGLLILFQVQANAQSSQKTALTPMPEISIIGSSVGGWDTDVALQTTDGENYYLSAKELLVGELKFRSNKSWDQNWGSGDFPVGIGTQGGQNIPVSEKATYNITFNVLSGAYNFEKVCICPTLYAPVCANGKMYSNECAAKCEGETAWVNGACEPTDTIVYISGSAIGEKQKMPRGGIGFVPYDANVFEGVYNLSNGDIHFQVQEQDMLYHLTGTTFPSGIAKMNYEVMIPVKEGTYAVHINIKTNEYHFIPTPFVSIANVNLTQVDNKGNYHVKNAALEGQDLIINDNAFGNDALIVLYGNAFPAGIAGHYGMPTLKVPTGIYDIYYNTLTKEYRFEPSKIDECICPLYINPVCANGKIYGNSCEAICAGESEWVEGSCEQNEIKVVISGTSLSEKITLNKGGVGMMAPSPKLFSTVQKFNTGTLKFEVQEADMLYQMSAETFPSGTATESLSEMPIPVKEGTYALIFDLETGKYDFHTTPYVSIAGVNLTQVDKNGNYEAKNVEIGETTLDVIDNDYGNDALMMLYGNNFPQGIATMETFAPVKTIPGTYNIYYNTNTKEYRFEKRVEVACICPLYINPVCANGKTYNNSCEAECAGETSWVMGECNGEYGESYVNIYGSAVGDPVRMVYENGVYTVKGKILGNGDVYFFGVIEGDIAFQMGGNSFPTGIAEYDEKPVLAEAGEYDIVLKLGEGGNTYTFTKLFMSIGEYNKNNVLVSPNPVKDILNISSNEFTQAMIYDYTGRLIKEVAVSNQTIDFSDLSSGNYILKLQSENNQEAIKIVKN
jgi:hypothetical protein